jgi:hypothetical protein
MTCEEFSNEFDVLVNSFTNIEPYKSLGLLNFDEYEKSVFLTKAQENIVLRCYNGHNAFGKGFEGNEEIRRSLNELVRISFSEPDGTAIPSTYSMSSTSYFFRIPSDAWALVYESVLLNSSDECLKDKELEVTPITYDEYHKLKKNPFRGSNDRRALRIDVSSQQFASDIKMVEIVCDYDIKYYKYRYLTQPSPIILTDLHDGLKINEITVKTECILNSLIHRTILDEAIHLALASRVPAQQSN